MRLTIDIDARSLYTEDANGRRELPLYSPGAFELLSDLWVKVGWAMRYSYHFSWLGRPVIQLPEDLVRMQEVLHRLQPDVLVETGVAHGGSLVFYASLFQAMGRGRVVGVDIEIRPVNRAAIEAHPLSSRITLIEGDSAAPHTLERVQACWAPHETVMVVLDSDHSKRHVARELQAYGPLVSEGSYLVVTDGIMERLADVPGGRAEWAEDNPLAAVREFLEASPEFRSEEPSSVFNDGLVQGRISYWPMAYLRRIAPRR